MTDQPPVNAPVLVDPQGKPARKAVDETCPGTINGRRCGAGPDMRIASCGFGVPHPLCRVCGFTWEDEVFRG